MDTEEVGTVTTDDGLSVETTAETSEAMKANFALEPKPPEEPEDPKKAEPGKPGSKAKAEEDDELVVVDAEGRPVEVVPENLEKAGEEPEKAGEEPEKKPNTRHDARARVMEATKKLAEERDRNRTLEARLDALEAGHTPEEPATAPEKPVRAQYAAGPDGDGEFIEALTDWKTDQKVEQLREESRQQAQIDGKVNADLQKVDAFNERLREASATDAEFMEKVDPGVLEMKPSFLLPPGTPPGPENDIAQAVVDSEYTAELMLYLSAHPEEIVRLSGLPDSFAVARAMGALEVKVMAEPPAPRLATPSDSVPAPDPEPQVSKAKPPVKPVSGSAQHSEEEVDDDMDLDTHMRIYNAKDERARRGR